MNDVFGAYNKENPNFMTYLVDGDQHMYTCESLYYTADALGAKDNNSPSNTGPMLTDYVNNFPLSNSGSAQSVCLGDLVTSDSRAPGVDNTYCSSKVVPKSFTQNY